MFPENPYGQVVNQCLCMWHEIDRFCVNSQDAKNMELFTFLQLGRLIFCAEQAHLIQRDMLNHEDRTDILQLISMLSDRFLMLQLKEEYQLIIQKLLTRIRLQVNIQDELR